MTTESIELDKIVDIRIDTYKVAVDVTGEFKNRTEDEAKFSTPYCVAAALLYGKITLDEFKEECLKNPQLAKIAKTVHLHEDPIATNQFPGGRKAKVEIKMSNGKCYTKSIEATDDSPDYLAVERKFMALTQGIMSEQRALEIKNIVMNIEKVKSVTELTNLLK